MCIDCFRRVHQAKESGGRHCVELIAEAIAILQELCRVELVIDGLTKWSPFHYQQAKGLEPNVLEKQSGAYGARTRNLRRDRAAL